MSKIIVSEYVSYGHPDKMADQISDALLDAYLSVDKDSKTGIEVMIKDNVVVLGGEVKSCGSINHEKVVRSTMSKFKFSYKHGLSPENIKIINLIGKQSPEINKGVEQSDGIIGAGDQGFMVGYASSEAPECMPLGVYLSKTIAEHFSITYSNVGPDVKSQVIIDYDGESPKLLHILVSAMHTGISLDEIRKMVAVAILTNKNGFIDPDIYEKYILGNSELSIDVNPCGSWEIGGPVADCGITGRKIVVDQFGGYANVGGGAFSGKDPSKVDRSAAYAARYIAKNIVAAKLAKSCKVTLSYMIGVPEPTSIEIDAEDCIVETESIVGIIRENIDLTPAGIISKFDLKNPIYYNTARYGHYGHSSSSDFAWEKIDLADVLNDLI